MTTIETLSLRLGFGIGTLAGTILGYVVGHHYKNNYRKDIREAHAETMDALEHVMWKIVDNQDAHAKHLEELLVKEFSQLNI